MSFQLVTRQTSFAPHVIPCAFSDFTHTQLPAIPPTMLPFIVSYLTWHQSCLCPCVEWLLQCMSTLSLVWLCMQSEAVVVPGVSAGTLLRAFVCLAALQACVNGSSPETFHVTSRVIPGAHAHSTYVYILALNQWPVYVCI